MAPEYSYIVQKPGNLLKAVLEFVSEMEFGREMMI
jgi:hypothetical protein